MDSLLYRRSETNRGISLPRSVQIQSNRFWRALQHSVHSAYTFLLCCNTQVRTVREVHRQQGHVNVVLGHLEPRSVDSVRHDHDSDRRVHVVDRENQVSVTVVILLHTYLHIYYTKNGTVETRK